MSTARPVIRRVDQLDDYASLATNHAHAASAITSGVLAIGRLATGTPDGTKFVRDDGTLQVPPGGLTQGTADTLYTGLAPATTARNNVVPTADVVGTTLREFAAPLGSGSALDIISTSIADDASEENYIGSYKKSIRFYATDTVFSKADPEWYCDSYGNWSMRRAFICSGHTSKATGLNGSPALRTGGFDYQIVPPTKTPGMISVWSDVDSDCLQLRSSFYTHGDGNAYLTCLSAGTDNRSSATGWTADAVSPEAGNITDGVQYLFNISYSIVNTVNTAKLRWGVGATRSLYDTELFRAGVAKLETNADLRMVQGKGLFGVETVGGAERRIVTFDGTNAQFNWGPIGAGYTHRFFGFHEFFNNAGDTIAFKIDGNMDITLADTVDVILSGTTGTKFGTATTQKLGFYNATPIVQPAGTTDLRQALINLGLYATGGATPLNLNGGALTAGAGSFTSLAASGTLTLGGDADLYRAGAGKLETTGDFRLKANKAIFGLDAGSAEKKILLFNDTNDSLDFSFANQSYTLRFFGWHEFYDNAASPALVFKTDGNGDLTLGSAVDVILNTTTGTKWGTAANQKQSFWGATAAVQPTAVADVSGGAIIDIEGRAAMNALLSRLRTIGIIAT